MMEEDIVLGTGRHLNSDRYRDDLSFEALESVSERLSNIREQLTYWTNLATAALFSATLLLLHLHLKCPVLFAVLPLVVYDVHLVAKALREIAGKTRPSLFRVFLKDAIESFSTLLFKLLLCVYIYFPMFPLWVSGLPLFTVSGFQVFYRGIPVTECWIFSGMFRVALRLVRVMAVIAISMKLDHYEGYSWYAALWPFWVSFALLLLISIGVLLLFVGSLCSYALKECDRSELYCSFWLLWTITGFSTTCGGSTLMLAYALEGHGHISSVQIFLLSVVGYLLTFLVFTRLMRRELVMWWDSFFVLETVQQSSETVVRGLPQTERKRRVSRKLTTLLISGPKMLTRISSTFFRPARRTEERTRSVVPANPFQYQEAGDENKVMSVSNLEIATNRTQTPTGACLVCYDSPRNAVIMPCGHGGVCYQCAVQMWKSSGMCHLCRITIEAVCEVAIAREGEAQVVKMTVQRTEEVEREKADGVASLTSQ